MDPALIASVISGAGVVLSLLVQYWIQHRLKHSEFERDRRLKRDELLAKYREPLLHAAFELQSRLYNTLQQGFFERFVIGKTGRDHDYGIDHTAYLIAQYFGWVEISRKELRFFDLGDSEQTRKLAELQTHLRDSWAKHALGTSCRLFAGVQRAIGERMLTQGPQGFDCMGFADFLDRLARKDVPIFQQLREEVVDLETDMAGAKERLMLVQHLLVDLIDFLDPHYLRYPKPVRGKVTMKG